jgi:hypothetical protein
VLIASGLTAAKAHFQPCGFLSWQATWEKLPRTTTGVQAVSKQHELWLIAICQLLAAISPTPLSVEHYWGTRILQRSESSLNAWANCWLPIASCCFSVSWLAAQTPGRGPTDDVCGRFERNAGAAPGGKLL